MDENIKRLKELAASGAFDKAAQFALDPLRDVKQYFPSATETNRRHMADMIRSIKSAPQIAAENIQQTIRNHITTIQASLAKDEQLVVCSTSGLEVILVENIGFPNWHTVILMGKDMDGRSASVVAGVGTIHLTCKIVKVAESTVPYRVGFIVPDAK